MSHNNRRDSFDLFPKKELLFGKEESNISGFNFPQERDQIELRENFNILNFGGNTDSKNFKSEKKIYNSSSISK